VYVSAELLVSRIDCSFSSVSALDRPDGLRALAEMLLVPAGGDVWLGAAGALKTAKITSLSNERRACAVELNSIQWQSAVFIGKIADEVDVGSQVCHQSSMSSTSSVVST